MIKKQVQYVIFDEVGKIRIFASKYAHARGNAKITDIIYAYPVGEENPAWKYYWDGSEWILTGCK